LRRLDTEFVALRRAARAAVIIPLALLFGQVVIGDPQALIFIVFGCFAMLVMADFGGRRPARWLAYLGAVLAGALLVALGTLVSATAVGAGSVMLVLGFGLAFIGIFGGYLATAQLALLLAFVIAVSLPAPSSAVPSRVGGWMLAGLISTIAAMVLWPRPDRGDLPGRAADAVLAVADVVEHPPPAGSYAEARAAVRAARDEYAAVARRPAGLTRMDRAYFEMFSELDQVIDLVETPFQERRATAQPSTDESDKLAATVLAELRASAAVLTGGPAPKLGAVEEARRAHRAALDRWVTDQLRAGRTAEEVLDGIDHDHTLRVISYIAIGLAGNAVIAAGGRLEAGIRLPAAVPGRPGAGGIAVRVLRTIRTHLEPRSPVLHNSLRLAVGLALSVLLARTLGFSQAFWVVLGTLQVLRTSALGTGRTTVQALAGNVIGVVVGGFVAALAGSNPALMWTALPVGIFIAAYAATTVGFALSQAAFTVNLIIVFNLISPAGWQLGLVRIEDVAAGAAVSIVVGILLWPRGARQELARSVSGFYRATAAYLGPAFDRVLGLEVAGDLEGIRRRAVRARDRADEGLKVLLSERGAKHMEPETATALVSAGNQGMLAADSLSVIAADLGYRALGCPDGAAAIRTQVQSLLARLTGLADRLEDHRSSAGDAEPVSAQVLRAAAIGCLSRGGVEVEGGKAALAVVMAREWAQNLARVETNLEQSVGEAAVAMRTPWWR
jgi:hypothetical protein